MSKNLENLLNDYFETEKSGSDENDYRSIVEVGLWDLLSLSSEVVDPIVNKIDSGYASEKNDIETSYKTTVDDLEKNYVSVKTQIETDCQTKLDDIQKSYETDMSNIKQHAKDEKQGFWGNAHRILKQAKEDHNYAIMISEISEKETLKKHKVNKAQTKKTLSSWKQGLDDLEKSAQQVLVGYHVRVEDNAATVQEIAEDEPDCRNAYQSHKQKSEACFRELTELFLPRMFLKTTYIFVSFALCLFLGLSLWLAQKALHWEGSKFVFILTLSLSALITLLILIGLFCRKRAKLQLLEKFKSLSESILLAGSALSAYSEVVANEHEKNIEQIRQRCIAQREEADRHYKSIKTETEKKSQALIANATHEFNAASQDLKNKFESDKEHIEKPGNEQIASLEKKHNESLARIKDDFEAKCDQVDLQFDAIRKKLRDSWQRRLDSVKKLFDQTNNLDTSFLKDWQDYAAWKQCKPASKQQKLIRFGTIKVDLTRIAEPVRELMPDDMKTVKEFEWPATLAFPNYCSLFMQTSADTKDTAIGLIKSAMARLFMSQPAGRVRFNIFDPIGLGENFVGFMHAADYEKSLIGGRIWTKREHIQKCLNELTTHMENVIQKYLRNEFETIEEYNQQAGELAEPYRFLVIADFPTNFSDESIRHLVSIINSGPKCGVYTMIVCSQDQKLPEGITQDDLTQNGVHLISLHGQFQWQNDTLKRMPLNVDVLPNEDILTEIVRTVGSASKDALKVEVPFELIAPDNNELWSKSSAGQIEIPIGKAGAKRFQNLQLGKGVNQHILIAGKTGSGKSTLFHIMITNLALWYSPDEIEMYLIDFKQGVEFKTYATYRLPHVKAVAIESDREFGLSILHKLDLEMTQRGETFRKVRVQDISDYRKTTDERLPRVVLIIDEFHILFAEDDKIAHDSTMLLEKLVRQGRAFGIHIILGSQSLAGAAGISRSIMGQMAVRIALQCSEMDTQYILNEDNAVASHLSRPGEAIYNDAGGLVVGNSPFQVSWLPKSIQDSYLAKIKENATSLKRSGPPMIIFEGNVPADISNNMTLAANLDNPSQNEDPVQNPPAALLGEPITIKQPTSVVFTRQNGANLLIVGQQEIAMTGILCSTMLSLLADLSPKACNFTLFNDNSSDSVLSSTIQKICGHFEHNCRFVNAGKIEDVVSDLSGLLKHRLEKNSEDAPCEFLIIPNLQRYRKLYRKEEEWGFDSSQETTVSVDKQFKELLQEGPLLGIHTIVGVDTFNTIERIFDRQTLREFNNRVLFQMSASDSNNLIDSPIANQLGFQRAILYNEEQGVIEKFRYYAPPEQVGNLNFTDLETL